MSTLKEHTASIFWPWSQMEYVPLEQWYLCTSPHGITTQKTNMDIFIAMRTWNPIQILFVDFQATLFHLFYILDDDNWHIVRPLPTYSNMVQKAMDIHSCLKSDLHLQPQHFSCPKLYTTVHKATTVQHKIKISVLYSMKPFFPSIEVTKATRSKFEIVTKESNKILLWNCYWRMKLAYSNPSGKLQTKNSISTWN
jgi:hypothetical protein